MPSRRAAQLHAVLAGQDGPGKRALPLGEFLHPLPLAALVLLAVNDHLLKGAGLLPKWVTGKLSDIGGLFFFPLLLTAGFDCALYAAARLTGWRVDFSLRRWKLYAAGALTAAVFIPLELSDWWGEFYVRTLGQIGFPSATYQDLSDLLCVVMIPLAIWFAIRVELRRLPLGRLEVLERRADADPACIEAALADVGDAALTRAVSTWLTQRDAPSAAALTDELRRVRNLP